jgi:UPF0716 family protein affecting phage T7 exclusion
VSRVAWLVVALVCATSSLGFGLSWLVSAPQGADHSCPAGSKPSDCHYPADQLSWTVWWTIGGLALGLGIGLTIRAIRNHQSSSQSI